MNAEELLRHYERIADAPDAVARLRRLVLDLAVRGKLVPQDPKDEPASELLRRIAAAMASFPKARDLRRPTSSPLTVDAPFSIAANWQWTRLSEIGVISPRNDALDASSASFVPMALIPAEYGAEHRHEVRPWGEIRKAYTHFADGDVGLAKITPCFENGKSTVFRKLTGGIGSGTTELHVVRPLLVVPDYVLLFLKCPHFIESGIAQMTGTAGQKRVPAEYFAHSPFPLPPLAEQHRIVAKVDELMALCDRLEAARAQREGARDRLVRSCLARLDTLDPETFREDARFALDALPALTARPDQIKQLRQTILNLAVRGKLVPQDSTDEPASRLLGRLSQESVTYCQKQRIALTRAEPVSNEDVPFSAPSGWRWARLCEVFKVITDGDHQPPPRADEGVAFLTIGNVTTGQLDFSGCRLVPADYFDALAVYRTPERGDILYTVVGATYGRPAPVETDRKFCVQRHIAILKPNSEMNLRFLVWMLQSSLVYDQATRSLTGAAQPTIALRPLRAFLVLVPPHHEQHRIVAKVDQLMALCDRLEASLQQGGEHRRKLLEALLHEALLPARAQEQVA